MNYYSERIKGQINKSKPGFISSSLGSICEIANFNIKNENFFEKLNFMTKNCEKVQRDVKKTFRKVSKKLRDNVKSLESLNYSGDEDNDKNWKQLLQEYKEKKQNNTKTYHKLKAMSFPDVEVKAPIKRMKVKNDLFVPERARVSISEIYSSIGKFVLSNNKRNFGELKATAKKASEKKFNQVIQTENRKTSIFKPTKLETKTLERVKNLPKLAKQIKHAKSRSILYN